MIRIAGRTLLCLFAAVSLSAAAFAQDPPASSAAAPAASAAAPEAAAGDQLVSNVFIDTDLRQALQDIGAQAGVNIIADPSVQGLVSVELTDETVDRALELVLAGTGYEYARFPNYYLVFGADQSADIFTDVAQTKRQRVYNVPAASARSLLPDALQRYVRVDTAANALVITAPRKLLARILADLEKIDLPPSEDTIVVALNHVRAPTALSQLPGNLQTFVSADAERNTLAVTAPIGTREVVIDHIRQLDVARGPGSFGVPDVHRTEVVKLNHAKAVATLSLLPPALAAYVRADEESNTLAVSAPGVLLGGILDDIAAIDVPRRHIMLDARVVVLERLDLLTFGANWRFPTLQAGASINNIPGDWPWELRIGYTPDREFTTALTVALNLLTANNEATIVANPQVLAQDGKPAEIRVTTQEYFQITSESATFIRSDLESIETGTILNITPQVGPDGELTLDMVIEVSDVVARGQQNLPVVSRRIARSTVQIESGGTAAVAGLVATRSETGSSGVPGVSNLPLLGHAFRTDTLNHQARQVAVFITATMVDEQGRTFQTGRDELPPIAATNETLYRQELEAALNQLETVN